MTNYCHKKQQESDKTVLSSHGRTTGYCIIGTGGLEKPQDFHSASTRSMVDTLENEQVTLAMRLIWRMTDYLVWVGVLIPTLVQACTLRAMIMMIFKL
jgi:hypothetical protein